MYIYIYKPQGPSQSLNIYGQTPYFINNSGCDYTFTCRLDLQGLGGAECKGAILEDFGVPKILSQSEGFRFQAASKLRIFCRDCQYLEDHPI